MIKHALELDLPVGQDNRFKVRAIKHSPGEDPVVVFDIRDFEGNEEPAFMLTEDERAELAEFFHGVEMM